MNKGIFNRLTFLATAAFMAAIAVLCLGIGFYWFNIIVPSIRASEYTRAEMVMAQVVEKLESAIEKRDRTGMEDLLVRLLLMKDPSTDESLILGISLETLEGAPIVHYSGSPVEISGPFAFTAPLYSPASHTVLGEVSFQYNPHFYEMLVEDGRKKMFWLLGMMAGVIFLLQRFLLRLLRPLSELNASLKTLDISTAARLPEVKGQVVSEISEVIQAMQDLLERLDSSRRTERRVREEMERAQEVSHTGSWVWDIVTNDLFWSDEVYRIFGLKPQEFAANYPAFLETVHAEDRGILEEAVAKAMAGEEEYDIVHRLVRPDGTFRFVREKSQVTFDGKGKAISMIGTVQDITEQKLAEDLSLRFGRIMDESFNEIYIIDYDTFKFVQINQSALRNMQYTMEEMSSMTPMDISPRLTAPEQLESLFKPLQEGTKDRIVITSHHQRKDGTDYPVEVRLQLSKHETPPRFVAIVQDITEQRKAEEAVQQAMQTLEKRVQERTADLEKITRENELILNTAGEGIYGIDKEGATTFLNPAAEHILGYSSKELIDKSHHDLCHQKRLDGSLYPAHECPIHKTLQDGQAHWTTDEVFWRKDGTAVPVEYVSNPIYEDEIVVGAVVTFKDITERKQAERDLILAKEEAERASNAKSEFLSQMSHELRTPLNAILGFGQVLESDPEEPLTEFQDQSVSEILKAGKHLLALINEILDLARIETGHLTLSLENVNVNELTEELMTLCHPLASKNNIEFLNYVSLHDDLYVHADRVRLKQVLLNLVSNAIKYNKMNGTVKIDATGNKRDGICISVSDTGVGIPKSRLADLFQPFNRLGSEKTDIEGTGVGLTITRQLVEMMNGSIEVESQPNRGSTFSITLPVGEPEMEDEDSLPKETDLKLGRLSSRDQWVVLYVEDNSANMNLVRQIFRRRPDVTLLTAPEAKLGIELAQAHRPDLILMDINLPGMDGTAAFGILRTMEETREIPVIAVSANALPRDIKAALKTGFSDYITKPLDLAEFSRVIEEHLQINMKRK